MRLVELAVVALVHFSCGRLTGIDDYAVGTDAASTGNDERVPTFARPKCAVCIAQHCAAPLAACLRDADCARVWECRKACLDPACHRLCLAQANLDVQFDRAYDAMVLDLFHQRGCLTAECADACRRGRNWDCLGDYAPPRIYGIGDRMSLALDVRLFTSMVGSPGVSDVRVSACGIGSVACNRVEGEAVTVSGRALLADLGPSDPAGFRGELAFHDERPDSGPTDGGFDEGPLIDAFWSTTLPWIEGVREPFLAPTLAVYNTWLPVAGTEFEPRRSYVNAVVRDCDLNPASGLEVTISTRDSTTQSFYWDAVPQAGLEATTLDGIVSFNFVPAGLLAEVTATDASGRTVAQGRLVPNAGSYTLLTLFPLTR